MTPTRVPTTPRPTAGALLGIVLVTSLALAACRSSTHTSTAPTTTAARATTTTDGAASASTTTPVPAAGPNGVNIVNYAFAPSTLTVKVGTTVTWKNYDQFAHEVISATGDPGQPFDLGQQLTGATVSHTFTAPGTYQYYCNIHNYMKGTIVVTG